jgi:cellulose synthase/poly-beta-1,6-N-acetylglucosamine synthase-like glycosyltransferase
MDWINHAVQWGFLFYLLVINGCYIMLKISALVSMSRYSELRELDGFIKAYSGFMPPISVLVPAYNEEKTIDSSVRSLLQLSYPEFEIIVVNDGSSDNTLHTLIAAFDLKPFPESYRMRISINKIRTVYCSAKYVNLKVIDKDNGGKADALNAGINISQYPLFCCIDADSVLQRNSLQKVVQPFLEDSRTVASGGTIRIANGCEIRDGFLEKVGLPQKALAVLQIVEYLRAFLFGRLGWSPLNALLIISGAFGVFHKETVIAAGAYKRDTIGEDMELVVRLHKYLRKEKRPYRITFVPDPVCWTEAPENLKTLKLQRIRWQRGLGEALAANISLLFNYKAGTVGWLAFPFMFFCEWLEPLVTVTGYLLVIAAFFLDALSLEGLLVFFLLSLSLGLVVSVTAFFLEVMSFNVYRGSKKLAVLFCFAVIENFGYRQLNTYWRLVGLYQWLVKKQSKWGTMARSGKWSQSSEELRKL